LRPSDNAELGGLFHLSILEGDDKLVKNGLDVV